jgi:four helix bundle suffix protein
MKGAGWQAPGAESPSAIANNTLTLQANYLLGRQRRRLEGDFLAEGGFTEKLHHARSSNGGKANERCNWR